MTSAEMRNSFQEIRVSHDYDCFNIDGHEKGDLADNNAISIAGADDHMNVGRYSIYSPYKRRLELQHFVHKWNNRFIVRFPVLKHLT